MSDNTEIERPANCGECAKFWECKGDGYDGFCDNWAGVPLKKTDVCHPNMGRKKTGGAK